MAPAVSFVRVPCPPAPAGRLGLSWLKRVTSLAVAVFFALLYASIGAPQWQADRGLVLVGTVVTMNDAGDVLRNARVFVRDGKIAAVAREDEDLPPEAADAVVVETDGVIYPGLIDLHNHRTMSFRCGSCRSAFGIGTSGEAGKPTRRRLPNRTGC